MEIEIIDPETLWGVKKFKIRTGMKFNRLIALYSTGTREGHSYWMFECECGNHKEIIASNVIHGNVKSCGCLKRIHHYLETKDELKQSLRRDFATMKLVSQLEQNKLMTMERDPGYAKAVQNSGRLTELTRKAQEEGLTYGQYKARLFIEKMRKEKENGKQQESGIPQDGEREPEE